MLRGEGVSYDSVGVRVAPLVWCRLLTREEVLK
jgi:hypothetical protein